MRNGKFKRFRSFLSGAGKGCSAKFFSSFVAEILGTYLRGALFLQLKGIEMSLTVVSFANAMRLPVICFSMSREDKARVSEVCVNQIQVQVHGDMILPKSNHELCHCHICSIVLA